MSRHLVTQLFGAIALAVVFVLGLVGLNRRAPVTAGVRVFDAKNATERTADVAADVHPISPAGGASDAGGQGFVGQFLSTLEVRAAGTFATLTAFAAVSAASVASIACVATSKLGSQARSSASSALSPSVCTTAPLQLQ